MLRLALSLTLITAPSIARAEALEKPPDLARVSAALLDALKKGSPLKPFMSARVIVSYHTDDRAAGSLDAEQTVKGSELDGTITLRGKTGGVAWESGRKIKADARAVKLDLRKETREILKLIDEHNRGSDPAGHMRPELDPRKLTYSIAYIAPSVKFWFRRDGKTLLVYKIHYAVEDPG